MGFPLCLTNEIPPGDIAFLLCRLVKLFTNFAHRPMPQRAGLCAFLLCEKTYKRVLTQGIQNYPLPESYKVIQEGTRSVQKGRSNEREMFTYEEIRYYNFSADTADVRL